MTLINSPSLFLSRGPPDECHEKVESLANGVQPGLLRRVPPGGDRWSVVTDKTFFNRNSADELPREDE